MKRKMDVSRDDGNILIMAVVIVALLIATGMGYMQWSSDEGWDTAFEEATVQAYFLAQTGVIEQGLQYLRTRTPSDLPQGTVFLPSGVVPGVGSYFNTKVVRVFSLGEGNVFQRIDSYDVYSTGRTDFVNHQLGNRKYGEKLKVERTASMRARLRSFANYMYLTNFEVTRFNEIIWFWTPDTLNGRTHSNDFIGLKYSPQFYGPVSTSQDRFIYYQPQNIHFEYEPQFNVPQVYFPTTANTIRNAAQPFVQSGDRQFMTWIKFRGEAGIDIYQYRLGTPPRDSLIFHLGVPNWQAIFVDGECEVEGIVAGTVTVGSAGDMWLIDDVKFIGTPRTGFFVESGMPHMLGLVSESNIIIKNNFRNGRENGVGVAPNDFNRHSIAITAGMVALGESFTFQHQNDDFELYQGPEPDERGHIYLQGAVTQRRRGYVHRSNHIGTGYGKAYHYDFRFDQRPPPYYLEALDAEGHGLFDIISWGEHSPSRR